jgi:hypothetical protein
VLTCDGQSLENILGLGYESDSIGGCQAANTRDTVFRVRDSVDGSNHTRAIGSAPSGLRV